MRIDFYGKFSDHRALTNIAAALEFFAECLVPAPQRRLMHLTLSVHELSGDDAGLTNYEGVRRKRLRHFVEIDSTMDLNATLETLAHELVHVKQILVDGLGRLPGGGTLFAGNKFRKTLVYEAQPWEIEAYALAEVLFNDFCDYSEDGDLAKYRRKHGYLRRA